MDSNTLLETLKQVMTRLDDTTIVSKVMLDKTLAEWMPLSFVACGQRDLWNQPSMYGGP